jgi:hypothetical protein
MKLDYLSVYRVIRVLNGEPEYGVFWSEEGWESGDWTATHLRGSYSEISKHVEEKLPFRLPTKEKLKMIEEKGNQVHYASGAGVMYINLIYNGKFIEY